MPERRKRTESSSDKDEESIAENRKNEITPMERFKSLARRIVCIPKSEVGAREEKKEK
jgi:hypothetical protein